MTTSTFAVTRCWRSCRKDMYEAVVTLGKEQKYDLILTQGVVYNSDKVDITDAVLKKLTGK